MRRVVAVRLLQTVILLVVVLIGSFLILRAAPGNPAVLQAGFRATPAKIAAISQSLGLDRPLIAQLGLWLLHVGQGDLGTSYTTGQSVVSSLKVAAPPTVQLTITAFVLTIVISIPLGVLAAVRRGGIADYVTRSTSLLGVAIPNFLLGLVFVLIFGWYFPNILPYQGYVSMLSDPLSGLAHTLLPALALAVAPIGILTALTRASMLDVLSAPYISAATAFGLPRHTIVLVDALKNALLPVFTVAGLTLGFLFSGSVLIENVFGIPGLGRLLVDSFQERDYPVAVGVMMIFAIAFVLVNLAIDLLYAAVNPQIRRGYGDLHG